MEIEKVSSFIYLGVVLSSGESFIKATNTLAGKALRAMNCFLTITRSMQVPKTLCSICLIHLYYLFLTMHVNYGAFQMRKI